MFREHPSCPHHQCKHSSATHPRTGGSMATARLGSFFSTSPISPGKVLDLSLLRPPWCLPVLGILGRWGLLRGCRPATLCLFDTDPAGRDPLAQPSLHLGTGIWCPMFRAGTESCPRDRVPHGLEIPQCSPSQRKR